MINQGTFVFSSKASTLIIKPSVLESLPSSSVYKCKLKSAAYPDFSPEVVNEMTLTILELVKNKIKDLFDNIDS